MSLFLFSKYVGGKWLGHMVDTFLMFEETAKQFSKVFVQFYIPTRSAEF